MPAAFAGDPALPVVSVGVWQSAQPVLRNRARPLAMEGAPPGLLGVGTGGARNRMKSANRSMPLRLSRAVAPSVSVTSFGVGAS